jgi:hypothetical protein
MGSINLQTLSDYHKHGYDLAISCRACGHETILTPEHLFDRGVSGSVAKLEKRLRCKCGARAARIHSTMLGPSGGVRRGRSWRDHVRG